MAARCLLDQLLEQREQDLLAAADIGEMLLEKNRECPFPRPRLPPCFGFGGLGQGVGFKAWGLIWGLGFRVEGLGFGFQELRITGRG